MSKTPASKKTVSKASVEKASTEKVPNKKTTKKTANQQEPRVLSQEIICADGASRIGVMTLNAERTMNAVDLEMINLIDDVLSRWQADDGIVAILMHGAGDRAFCAGGDIRQLYESILSAQNADSEDDSELPPYYYADSFFTAEYSKNYRVHLLGKPLIAWGNGFVMGGGLGLFIGANHKVGTESLKLAWPEINIGLFPDVAGSYYLSRLEFPLGHWMGLSGSHMNAVDSKDANLINYCLPNKDLEAVIAGLLEQPWQANKAMNNQHVRNLLKQLELNADEDVVFPASNLAAAKESIDAVFEGITSEDNMTLTDNKEALNIILERFKTIESDNEWFNKGRSNFLEGCPGTAHLVMQQLEFGCNMTLKEVAKWELMIAMQSVRHPDFAEGVRAMVVDKDFSPRWQHASVSDVPEEWVKGFFQPLWEDGEHPFSEL